MKFVVIDRCPVPAEIAPQVKLLKHDVPHAVLNSAYRGDLATSLLKRLGKMTQRMLWDGWRRHLPGYNPANPPGQSTHELYAGGVYRGPKTRPIRAWGCGLDWGPPEVVDDVIEAAEKRGWVLFRPYSSGSERHHVNFRRKPRLVRKRHPAKPAEHSVLPRRISSAGIDLIASFEGCRLHPYRDIVGVWTIGFGHTAGVTAKTPPLPSVAAAKSLLARDLRSYEQAVSAAVHVPLTQLQFDALVSLCYNIGAGAFASSTLVKRLNTKHYGRAANQFLVWNRAGGRKVDGLTRRRKAERALFLSGSNRKTRAGAATGAR